MATAHLARDLKHDHDVAITVLHHDVVAALGAARFLAEIRTTARLQDDNWDVGPGGRFLMVKGDPNAGTRFLVVLDWIDELRSQFKR